MVRFAKITVVLLEGTIVQFSNTTLLEVVKACLSYPLANENPLLIQISEEYKLYFNTEIFISWVQKEVSLQELLEQVKVNYLVRNKTQITADGIDVDSNSLWLQKGKLCILADQDSFVHTYIDERFTVLN